MKPKKENIRKFIGNIIARGYYDMQEVRIATKNRIRDIIRKKIEGIGLDQVEEKKEKDYSAKYSDEELFKGLKNLLKKKKISKEEFEYLNKCWEMVDSSELIENKYKAAMMEYVEHEPIYTTFLKHVRGIGPVLAANLLKEFGYCEKYEYVTRLWSHAGQGVVAGVAPKRKKGEATNYSPRLKSLVWKVSDCLMKSNKGYYRQLYDTEKKVQLARKYKKGELFALYGKPYKEEDIHISLLHAHNRALRKMRKIFLSHYFDCGRELAGLPIPKPFVEEKLQHTSIITWRDALKQEKTKPPL